MRGPYIRSNREYESPIGQFRIALGMTIKELCDEAGCSPGTYGNLQNGLYIPYDPKTGQVKSWVNKMSIILGASLSELFPRYICEINRLRITLNQDQVNEITISEFA